MVFAVNNYIGLILIRSVLIHLFVNNFLSILKYVFLVVQYRLYSVHEFGKPALVLI